MNKKALYLLHAVIISLFLVFTLANARSMSGFYGGAPWGHYFDSFLFFGLMLAVTYASYLVFVPRFLARRQYVRFTISLLSLVVGFTVFFYLLSLAASYFLQPVPFHLCNPQACGSVASLIVAMGMAGTFFRLFVEWISDAYAKRERDKQHLKSELALLKSQINPHFLFNTLNNIDSLIQGQSTHASQALNKLSGIMRYVVYDSEHEFVPLTDEINYISDFISLQKLRIVHQDLIEFTVKGPLENKQVPPMLFISFVENAFKHSPLANAETEKIIITITAREDKILFHCENPTGDKQKDAHGGVGLPLVRKRLDLLYRKDYKLAIRHEKNRFIVDLEIMIS